MGGFQCCVELGALDGGLHTSDVRSSAREVVAGGTTPALTQLLVDAYSRLNT